MDRLIDHMFIFEGDGVIRDYPGTYSQYRATVDESPDSKPLEASKKEIIPEPESKKQPKRQLSFKEKREFESLEKDIPALTAEKKSIAEKMASGNLPFEELQQLSVRVLEVEKLLDQKELRWLELSDLA
jgi:ATP-binding cassette subfamily F protein uup